MGDRGTSASPSTASRARKARACVLNGRTPLLARRLLPAPVLVVEKALEASPLTLAVATAQAGGALGTSARRPCRRASTVTRRGRRRGSSHAPVPALERASRGAMADAGRGTPRLAQLHAQLSVALRSALKSPDLAVRPPAGRVEASVRYVSGGASNHGGRAARRSSRSSCRGRQRSACTPSWTCIARRGASCYIHLMQCARV